MHHSWENLGILSPWDSVPWDIVLHGLLSLWGFVPLGFCHPWFLSRLDFVPLGFCPPGILSPWVFVFLGFCPLGYCPMGFCPLGFCPRIIYVTVFEWPSGICIMAYILYVYNYRTLNVTGLHMPSAVQFSLSSHS